MNAKVKSKTILMLLLCVPVSAGLLQASPKAAPASGNEKHVSTKASELHDAMRKLWEDHITWTRLFIVSAAGNLPDKQATTNRLLQNQVDIGNAIKPYYGNEAGDKLTTLLKEHITLAAELVSAAQASETAKMEDANKIRLQPS
jgi:hypothetical protein